MTTALLLLSGIMAVVVGWLVRQTIGTTPWVERRALDSARRRRRPGAADDQGRPGRVSCRRDVAVHAADQRLPHAHGGSGLDQPARAMGAVAEHRVADPRQCGDAEDAACRATGPDRRRAKRVDLRRGIQLFICGRAALGLAADAGGRLFCRIESGLRVLLPAHCRARVASAGRAMGVGQDRRQGRGVAPRRARCASVWSCAPCTGTFCSRCGWSCSSCCCEHTANKGRSP